MLQPLPVSFHNNLSAYKRTLTTVKQQNSKILSIPHTDIMPKSSQNVKIDVVNM